MTPTVNPRMQLAIGSSDGVSESTELACGLVGCSTSWGYKVA